MTKRRILFTLVIVLAGLTIAAGVYNWFCNKEFFSASITQVLTLAVTLIVAYWATQYKADERKTKEHAEDVIRKLQALVSDTQFFAISADGDLMVIQTQINSTNRKINNCLTILEEYAESLSFKKDMAYIRSQFESYKTLIGDHISDLDYLSKSEIEFKRISENIDTRCDYIILGLYK